MSRKGFYITVTSGMKGFYAIKIIKEDGYEQPYETGFGYPDIETTIEDGKEWARAEYIPFEMPTLLKDEEPCSHPGCLSHVTHPCEVCGRTAGRTKV